MRVHLLKAPINNPPEAPMSYITSKWFYYEVLRDLYKEQRVQNNIFPAASVTAWLY
jgi:hypothetical protein